MDLRKVSKKLPIAIGIWLLFLLRKKVTSKNQKIFPISLSFYNPFITFAVSSFKTFGGVGEWLKPPVC
jgi:hypothetical protein